MAHAVESRHTSQAGNGPGGAGPAQIGARLTQVCDGISASSSAAARIQARCCLDPWRAPRTRARRVIPTRCTLREPSGWSATGQATARSLQPHRSPPPRHTAIHAGGRVGAGPAACRKSAHQTLVALCEHGCQVSASRRCISALRRFCKMEATGSFSRTTRQTRGALTAPPQTGTLTP